MYSYAIAEPQSLNGFPNSSCSTLKSSSVADSSSTPFSPCTQDWEVSGCARRQREVALMVAAWMVMRAWSSIAFASPPLSLQILAQRVSRTCSASGPNVPRIELASGVKVCPARLARSSYSALLRPSAIRRMVAGFSPFFRADQNGLPHTPRRQPLYSQEGLVPRMGRHHGRHASRVSLRKLTSSPLPALANAGRFLLPRVPLMHIPVRRVPDCTLSRTH